MMNTKFVIGLVISLIVGVVQLANGQQPAKVPLLGYLGTRSASQSAGDTNAFRQGLNDHGYIEGKNIGIEYR